MVIWDFTGGYVDESISGCYIRRWLSEDMTLEIMISF